MLPKLVGRGWSGRGAVWGGVCGAPQGICDPTSFSNGVPGLRCPLGTGLLVGQSAAPRVPSSWWGAWAAAQWPWDQPGTSSPSGAG